MCISDASVCVRACVRVCVCAWVSERVRYFRSLSWLVVVNNMKDIVFSTIQNSIRKIIDNIMRLNSFNIHDTIRRVMVSRVGLARARTHGDGLRVEIARKGGVNGARAGKITNNFRSI